MKGIKPKEMDDRTLYILKESLSCFVNHAGSDEAIDDANKIEIVINTEYDKRRRENGRRRQ